MKVYLLIRCNKNLCKYLHLKNVYTVATKIYESLPEQIKQTVDLKAIQDAAILHDYGKILIPSEIL